MNLSQCSAPGDSPWIRGAPQSGVAAFICRIILRISRSSDGRPDVERQRQNRLWWNVG